MRKASEKPKIETRGRKPLPPGKAKIQRNISLDPEVWKEAKARFDKKISPICESALKRAINRDKRKGGKQ